MAIMEGTRAECGHNLGDIREYGRSLDPSCQAIFHKLEPRCQAGLQILDPQCRMGSLGKGSLGKGKRRGVVECSQQCKLRELDHWCGTSTNMMAN